MRHRLGDKLNPTSTSANEPAGTSNEPIRAVCFARSTGNAILCSYRTIEGTTWAFPIGQLLAARAADDGRALQIVYSGGEVRLEGARLDKVRDAIIRGHAFEIHAVNPTFRGEYEDEVFVSSVTVTEERRAGREAQEPDAP
jgi:hypothetical protein